MLHPLLDGALDNTLGQSAYGWLRDRANPLLDPLAPRAFRDFVDAYVNVRRRHFPLPYGTRTDLSIHEPLISLWQDQGVPIEFASAPAAAVSRETLWSAFLQSVDSQTRAWSHWIRFAWTPEVVPGFKVRVEDWQEQLRLALDDVLASVSRFAEDNAAKLLVGQLEADLAQLPVDREFRDFARARATSIPELGAAYAWNWFVRGASYQGRAHGMSVRFHDLRDRAVVSPCDMAGEPTALLGPLPWGHLLAKSIEDGIIPSDSSRFCEVLRMVRDTVQTDGEYEALLVEAKAAERYEAREESLKAAIGRAFARAGRPPLFHETTRRARVLAAVAKMAAEATTPGISSVVRGVAYEIVDLGLNSRPAREFEYLARQRLHRASLWKLFRVPGRD